MEKETRRNIKRIQKEIDRLKEELRKIELRPCSGDAELKKKEKDLRMLKQEISELEKEARQYELYVSAVRQDV
jgi:peptidoglycan hydrolase CwlO-like protein